MARKIILHLNRAIRHLESPPIPHKYQSLIMFGVSLLITGYILGPNLFAKWWIIDDHEIMWFLGKVGYLSFDNILPKLMQTEVGHFGESSRFRPAYYTLRLLECWMFGKNPELWYGIRLAIFCLFVYVLWQILTSKIGFFFAGLVVLYIATFFFWSDIFIRLGPAEIYAIFGVTLFIIGFDNLYNKNVSNSNWFLLFSGLIIASGSKENFVLLLVFVLFIIVRLKMKRKSNWLSWMYVFLSFVWCGLITISVFIAIGKHNTDIYGNSIAATDRLKVFIDALARRDLLSLYLRAILFLVLWLVLRKRRYSLSLICLKACLCILSLVGLYLSQVFFYNGNWPTNTRYDFPGQLYFPLLIVVIIWFVQRSIKEIDFFLPYQPFSVLVLASVCIVLVVSHLGEAISLRQLSIYNVKRTISFTNAIEDLRGIATKNSDMPIVFQTDYGWDYEPVFSIPRFLESGGVNNQEFFIWTGETPTEFSNFEATLTRNLIEISKDGIRNYYAPLEQLPKYGSNCILVVLSGAPGWPCKIKFHNLDYRNY